MSKELKVIGLATGKTILVLKEPIPHNSMNLMDFLRSHHLPIASSCYGDGVCQKCKVTLNGHEILTCQVSLLELINKDVIIEIGYL